MNPEMENAPKRKDSPRQGKNRFFQVFFSAAGVLLLSKLLGFAKQMATAAAFGTSAETDLISLATGFIGNSQFLLVQALLTAFLPVYLHIQDEKEAGYFASDVLKSVSIIATSAAGVLFLAAPMLARLMAPSYTSDRSNQLAFWLRLLVPTLLFFMWIAVFRSLLDAHQRFLPGQMEGINQSVVLFLLLPFLAPRLGARTLAVALIVYTVWNTVFLGIPARKYLIFSIGPPFRNPAVRELLRLMAPMLLSQSLLFINQLVDKSLASGLASGVVTAMGYAAVLNDLVATFIETFCSMLFSYITVQIAQGNEREAAHLSVRSASLLLLAFLPISILTVLCAEDIITIAFARGAFSQESVQAAAAALRGYSFMFTPLIFRNLFSRFQYGYKDTRRPMLNSVASIGLNIVLSMMLCSLLGVFGITLATSISVLLCGALNLLSARRHNSHLNLRFFLQLIPLTIPGSILCALSVSCVNRTLSDSQPLIRFSVSILCGTIVYLFFVLPIVWRLIKQKD